MTHFQHNSQILHNIFKVFLLITGLMFWRWWLHISNLHPPRTATLQPVLATALLTPDTRYHPGHQKCPQHSTCPSDSGRAPSPRRTSGARADQCTGTRRGNYSTGGVAGGVLGTLLMTGLISGVGCQQGCGHHRLQSGGTTEEELGEMLSPSPPASPSPTSGCYFKPSL